MFVVLLDRYIFHDIVSVYYEEIGTERASMG